ncbi:hypothetical protein BOTBODRAFT_52946 [Botryobasidium botryosum FD-172 SS1]|uniref:Major facilitator superfamily (MFS) profile domain-containing protein n=1 Tax=Botryobasidium botryosum (strain FD-172 SS1) TaxID=930990 RepID=A0A067N1W7_BOTB1|nr:hypothetical protein BOTBODRAFT_52946 [Botryobasidium botryosum FD-172 SS1]
MLEQDSPDASGTVQLPFGPPPPSSTSDDKDEKDSEFRDDEDPEFHPPDGGLRAWGVVLGSWCAQFVAFGPSNSFGTLQAYYRTHQLAGLSPSTISWIGSVQIFVLLMGGCFCGRLYDAYGPRWLLLSGSVIYALASFLLSVCKEFYQFLLVQGFLLGIGSALIYIPSIAAISEHFSKRKGLAMGIAITSGGIGGIVFTQMVSHLLDRIGFGWTTRVLAFIFLGLLAVANLTIKSLLPPRKASPISEMFIGLKDPNFLFLTVGGWFFSLGVTPVFFFLPEFALSIGAPSTFALYCTTFLNVGSILGRLVIGFISDRLGRFNSGVIFTFLSGLLPLTMWITCRTTPTLIAFALMWGFVSGGCETLLPSCAGQISTQRLAGSRLGALFGISSSAYLISGPITGAIIARSNASLPAGYVGAAVFCGTTMLISSACVVTSRFTTDKRLFVVV